jgi:multicomponent Na+:H+ antiporter subunit E
MSLNHAHGHMKGKNIAMRLITILLTFAFLWWLMADGQLSSWIIGIPAIMFATWAFVRLNPQSGHYVSLVGLLRFIPFFLIESLRGGIDVAARTLHPRLNIKPGFYRYQLKLEDRIKRVFFINCVNLLPGTLTADIHEDCVEIHLLSEDIDPKAGLSRLEEAVGQIFVVRGKDE